MPRRVILSFAVLSAFFISCRNDSLEETPQDVILEQSYIDGRAYDALRNAGIAVNELNSLFGAGSWFGEIDKNGDGIHYTGVCATKDDNALIYLLKFVVKGQESRYNPYEPDAVESFSYVKTYTFPIPERQIVIDHGYGNKDTLGFAGTAINNFIQSGNNYYAAIHDLYADGVVPHIRKHDIRHFRLLMDNSDGVRTIPYELVKEDIPSSGLSGYDNGLWAGHDGSVICGPYCFSKDGEILFRTSSWSDLYRSDVKNAALGSWFFPISDDKMFIVYFDEHYTKGEPCVASVGYTLDDIRTGDAVYFKSVDVDSAQNIYSPARFVSEKDGIYKFEISAIVYSGDKKTFRITIDRDNQTCAIDQNAKTSP